MENEQKKQKKPTVIVGALIENKKGKILLAESKKWIGMHTVLGGHVEFGEKLEDAIMREIKEEAGIKVEILDKLGFEQSIFDKKFHAKDKHFVFTDFLCKYDGEDDKIVLNSEFKKGKYRWIEPQKALDKLNMPHGTRELIKRYLKYKETQEYLQGWKRCQADFENYKRRQDENNKEAIKYASQNVVMQVLPVLDNFQASVNHIPEDQKDGPWVQGIMYIQKQLESVLEENGVNEIKVTSGDDFDPQFHEAIEDKENKDDKKEYENKIDKVIQKGYQMGDKIIRPAKVIVK